MEWSVTKAIISLLTILGVQTSRYLLQTDLHHPSSLKTAPSTPNYTNRSSSWTCKHITKSSCCFWTCYGNTGKKLNSKRIQECNLCRETKRENYFFLCDQFAIHVRSYMQVLLCQLDWVNSQTVTFECSVVTNTAFCNLWVISY